MCRQRIRILVVLALAAVQGAATPLREAPAITGAWTLDRTQSDDVNAKINATIARMNVVVRQIARGRLRATNVPYPQLIFSVDQNISVDMPGYPSVSSPANGEPVLWHRRSGRSCTQMRGSCVQVTTAWDAADLVQTFRAEDGQRQNVFTVSEDGSRLTMVATLTSPRLPAPLVYRLVYTRRS